MNTEKKSQKFSKASISHAKLNGRSGSNSTQLSFLAMRKQSVSTRRIKFHKFQCNGSILTRRSTRRNKHDVMAENI